MERSIITRVHLSWLVEPVGEPLNLPEEDMRKLADELISKTHRIPEVQETVANDPNVSVINLEREDFTSQIIRDVELSDDKDGWVIGVNSVEIRKAKLGELADYAKERASIDNGLNQREGAPKRPQIKFKPAGVHEGSDRTRPGLFTTGDLNGTIKLIESLL